MNSVQMLTLERALIIVKESQHQIQWRKGNSACYQSIKYIFKKYSSRYDISFFAKKLKPYVKKEVKIGELKNEDFIKKPICQKYISSLQNEEKMVESRMLEETCAGDISLFIKTFGYSPKYS